jgi:hemolysin activation/secretion protein
MRRPRKRRCSVGANHSSTVVPAAHSAVRILLRPFVALLSAAALLLLHAGGAHAQAVGGPHFAVRGFRVNGPNPLSPAETAAILQPYVGPDATLQSLQAATSALERALRERGYRLHYVQLPAQELGETVVLEVAAVTLDSVTVTGVPPEDEASVRRELPALREGETPDLGRLAIETDMVNTGGHRQVVVDLRESSTPGRVDALVEVTQKKPWSVGAFVSNTGTKETGRDRLTVTGSHANVFGRDHQLVAAYTTSVERTSDVKQFGAAYSVPLYQQGAAAAVSYTQSDVVGQFGTFSSTGAGHVLRMSYTLNRPPQGELHSQWVAALQDAVYRGAKINDEFVGPDRRTRIVSLGYALRRELPGRVWALQAELVANTGSGSHDTLEDYRSEYAGISTVHWTALRASGSWIERLPRDWGLSLRSTLQYTADALIAGEQFGLGGLGSVRGTTTERPLAGDRGVSASAELLTPLLAERVQGVLFLDAGWIGNVAADGVQRIASDRLVGTGLGLRYAAGKVQAGAEYGRLLVGSRMPLAINPSAPQRGDDRVYVNLGVRF